MKGFREFVIRGNVMDLAVAVVIGAAFTAVVNALVKDLLTPLIAAIVGAPDFSGIAFEVNGSKLLVGDFLNAVIAFLMLATVVCVGVLQWPMLPVVLVLALISVAAAFARAAR